MRALLRETELNPSRLVAPLFVCGGTGVVRPVEGLPGLTCYSAEAAASQAKKLSDLGIRSFLLFGVTDRKDETGSGAYSPDGVVPSAVKEIRTKVPDGVIMADVCLCEYTSHGHCGVLSGDVVDNDATIPLLGKAALAYARAGADVVAPSAMMDGQVAEIRSALDGGGFKETLVMGYSAKYASSFYGPFRDAAGSAPSFGDRRGYQMDPPNAREALREIESDVREGADIVMVKPALAYLDVIASARARFDLPIAAYNVSGEYAMVVAASRMGWVDEERAAMEVLTSIRRAGADIIITYFAEKFSGWGGSRP
ncbi:MAG: porphobilinogen synthase [archaeon]|nr:MAG: porphobilinogen synthase [archaeon]